MFKAFLILVAFSCGISLIPAKAATAPTKYSLLKETLETRVKIVTQEIKTLKLKVKVDSSDQDLVNELSAKETQLKTLKGEIQILKQQIKVEKDTQDAYKKYTDLNAMLSKLTEAAEAIAADEDY